MSFKINFRFKVKTIASDQKDGLPTTAIIRSTNYPLDQMAKICSILPAKPINTCQVFKNNDIINFTRKKNHEFNQKFLSLMQKNGPLKIMF